MKRDSGAEMTTLEIWKGPDAELRVGGLRLVACRREVDTIDGGVTLCVWNDLGGRASRELLRLDLFRNRPHYHAPADRQEETRIDAGSDEESTCFPAESMSLQTTRASRRLATTRPLPLAAAMSVLLLSMNDSAVTSRVAPSS